MTDFSVDSTVFFYVIPEKMSKKSALSVTPLSLPISSGPPSSADFLVLPPCPPKGGKSQI